MNNLVLLYEKPIGRSGQSSGARCRYCAPLFSGKQGSFRMRVCHCPFTNILRAAVKVLICGTDLAYRARQHYHQKSRLKSWKLSDKGFMERKDVL